MIEDNIISVSLDGSSENFSIGVRYNFLYIFSKSSLSNLENTVGIEQGWTIFF